MLGALGRTGGGLVRILRARDRGGRAPLPADAEGHPPAGDPQRAPQRLHVVLDHVALLARPGLGAVVQLQQETWREPYIRISLNSKWFKHSPERVTFLTQILRNGQMRNWGSLLMMKNRFTAQLPMCPVVGSLEKLKLWLLYNCLSKSTW
ncbi:NADH dehydrogenase [ubiquinone] 1 beta subcomplex subunit 2, mitochondrial isoform X1 [Chrysemys picta bellii]|uniref:NADH dehydrogenase [ubiquinone] 1 beta subcomplex subunit 2, mitochondrial isoform X1 n=1 Tax=Chrysemys picta bellii TaxID=8478 RepID=UPI0032B30B19